MKTAELGDYFEWDGQIVKCEWINEGSKSIGFVIKEECPHCGGDIRTAMNVIESSPQFQDRAKPIKSIKGMI